MEDERGFIQEANTPGILQTRIQYATLQLPTTWHELLKESFHDVQWGTTCRTAEAVLTSILKLVMWWSDWCHLDCVKHSYPSTPDFTYPHFLEASSWNYTSYHLKMEQRMSHGMHASWSSGRSSSLRRLLCLQNNSGLCPHSVIYAPQGETKDCVALLP